MGFLHTGATGRESHPSYQSQAEKPPDAASWLAPLAAADRACCCTARPVVMAVMPPTPQRPQPVDLLLCGHHYRTSKEALEAAGAVVYDSRAIVADVSDEISDPEPVH